MTQAPPEITASPTTRKRALEKGVDIDALARDLGRTTIGPEDIDAATGGATGGTTRAAPPAAAPGDTSYWEVDHIFLTLLLYLFTKNLHQYV